MGRTLNTLQGWSRCLAGFLPVEGSGEGSSRELLIGPLRAGVRMPHTPIPHTPLTPIPVTPTAPQPRKLEIPNRDSKVRIAEL